MVRRARVRALGLAVAVTLAAVTLGLVGMRAAPTAGQGTGLEKINHVVVIYQENWSFDSLFGKFPGANGLQNAGATTRQVDKGGQPYAVLPQPIDTTKKPAGPDPRFPANLPVAPFDVSRYVPANERTGDLVHRFYQQQYQIDGGKMDKFVAWSDAAGLALSYYDATNLPAGKLAPQYALADNFFHAAFGGSFINHFWLVCACTAVWANAPADVRAQLDAQGVLAKDGAVTPDGYAVNTAFSVNQPHPAGMDAGHLIPNQTAPTIGDRLEERGVSWAWYAGGWKDALAGHPPALFQFHHHPFSYFARYADGTPGRRDHLKDEMEFFADLKDGQLPAVAFVKPLGPDNEHPGYADLLRGQQHVVELVAEVMRSRYWKDTAIVITYDENGGRWDHVPPPVVDRWGPGTRVPAIIVSPYAKRHYVDHTRYDTTSILKLIEQRWNIKPLSSRDAAAGDLRNAFAF